MPPRPEKSAPVLPATLDRPSCSPTPTPSYESPADDTCFTTEPDQFGLYRVYPRKPFHEPDDGLAIENACDEPNRAVSGDRDSNQRQKRFGSPTTSTQATLSPFAPLSNATSFRLLDWFYGGSRQKSQIELTSLVENVLRADDYSKEDAATFSFSHETALLDAADSTSPFANETIWKRSTIKILLPCERHKFSSEDEAPKLRIRNVRHRSLVEVMRTAAKDESAKLWHNTPFKMFWKPTPESLPQRIISELYNADAFLEEHDKISKLPAHLPSDPPTPKPVENAVFAIMIWSDSTHLTNFGDASMWPIYLYPGNQSKYPRGRPTQHSAHHVAYIPSVITINFIVCRLLTK
ncbi:hypothetical protein CPB84DRAFT_1675260 [Gymnopilus junonius]|uniref:Uncharacterized protein n=1 Tax=Gymnopilus junonius TaxID=109634 RepID=A0A9P5NUG5_GYMJU|nr:hypothetical protein CPB84DRAFT_1675260 [Gymnopilus junonius]